MITVEIARWLWDWAHESGRYVVPETFTIHTRHGDVTVPQGLLFDGASCAPNGSVELMRAWALHDWLYATGKFDDGTQCPRPVADELMRELMRPYCWGWVVWMYWKAVRVGGVIPWERYRMMELHGMPTTRILDPSLWRFPTWEAREAESISAR